jgi:PDZ domain-containing protein
VLLIVLVIVLVGIIVLGRVQTNDYAITPGTSTPVAPLVKIDGVKTNSHDDQILLTDVYLSTLTAWQWITEHFQSHVQFIPADELVEPGVSTSELDAQGYLEMSDAKQAAEVAAFRALGWTIPATPSGTVITGVVAPSPANTAGLGVGDEIVGVNSTSIDSDCALVDSIHDLAPGTTVTLKVDRVKISNVGVLSYGSTTSSIKVTTAAVPSGLGDTGCPGVTGVNRSWLGVSLEDGFRAPLPATVNIDTADIGGPSAGLAMTLTMINKLSSGSLTGHHIVAATGTMAMDGQVGAVGGVEEKAVAVHRAGATYFIVPDGGGNVAAARAADQPDLTILPVSSLKQALQDLRRLGGVKPIALSKPS